ncbi:MAG TPA: phospholipase D family protein, partial [Ktedonobacteraceae bacterium]
RMTMLAMCICFLRAKRTIFITAFGLSPEMFMVRGKHKCAGPAGSAEQEKLLDWLREKGLSEKDLHFWQTCEELSVTNVLRYVISKGVDVRVLLWDTYTLPFSFHANPVDVQKALAALGVRCVLDDSHKGLLNHPLEAHHQKTAIVDSRIAFVGGIDVMMGSDGDFDRWDTKGHVYNAPLRINHDGKMPHSWHDTHVIFEGPAVSDVELNFCQRWNDVIELHRSEPALKLALPARSVKQHRWLRTKNAPAIQVIRTIPQGTYAFAPEDGIATILDAYRRAFAQAKRYIYLENQYLWQRTFLGFEHPALGLPNADMAELLQALGEALKRGVSVTLILPDNPNVGREFTDEGLHALREMAPEAVTAGTLQAFTLGSSMQQEELTYYRSIYVHAKTTIVDDAWVTLGSANLNNRGMRNDTELNVAILYPELAQHLRILLMAEHLGLYDEDTLFQLLDTLAKHSSTRSQKKVAALKRRLALRARARGRSMTSAGTARTSTAMDEGLEAQWARLISQLGDPIQGNTLLAQQARDNLLAVQERRPLSGHVLPYVPYKQAKEYQIEVHAVNGWLDSLSKPHIEPEDKPAASEAEAETSAAHKLAETVSPVVLE